ncbi:FG-GAP-like repeat-containing protein [Lysobacter firmicutimachus]|uniref:FG-GAP-like repeat-containing protein n=1 Tax=Lysobacter firmicutimachus TaxID=1792846 RepID=A0AAU8N1G0_9GAMM
MHKRAGMALVAISLAGCGSAGRGTDGVAVAEAAAVPATAPSRRFAAAADRGELWAYVSGGEVLREQGLRWHRIGLSEAHARSAVAGGRLRLRTPAGRRLTAHYERDATAASGDWTWIGRIDGEAGQGRVVLTFGATSAYGSISQPGGTSLELTTRDGAAWAVESDPAGAASIAAAKAAAAPDFLIPPAPMSGAARDGDGATMAAAAPATSATGSYTPPSAVIDLVVGIAGPNQEAMTTKLNQMVAVGNDLLFQSLVNARLRVVRTVPVNYASELSSRAVLERMSGANGVSVDPAFDGLRAARDAHGGDLVVLLRDAGNSTADCGAGWLIGAGGRGIAAGDSGYGYSVVNAACANTALMHQVAHNLGAQHDREHAGIDGAAVSGAYSYSYGYRYMSGQYPSGSFLAYEADRYLWGGSVFSNPRISAPCGWTDCGQAGYADNALTLNRTTPVVGAFRNETVRAPAARDDYNVDGRADMFWHNAAQAQFSYWRAGGTLYASGAFHAPWRKYQPIGLGDFNTDSRVDVLWRDPDNGSLTVWTAHEDGFVEGYIGETASGLGFVGVGDFNGDDNADVLWRDLAKGEIVVWIMRGLSVAERRTAPMPAWFEILGIGDFQGRGLSDIVYASANDVNLYVNLNGGGFAGVRITARPSGWKYAATADMNDDGREDMFWLSPNGDALSYWLMNGPTIQANPSLPVVPGQSFVTARNYSLAPGAELIWNRPPRSGESWPSMGHEYVGAGGRRVTDYTPYPPDWKIVVPL